MGLGEQPNDTHPQRPYRRGLWSGGNARWERAISASYDQTLRVWNLENGKEITTFIGESRMSSCASGPDGRTIVAGDEAGRVHFLRLVEADETKPLIGDAMITLLDRKEQVLHEAEKP
jgi:WD40 repeat protein